METPTCGRDRLVRSNPVQVPTAETAGMAEPPVRRWPHPVPPAEPARKPEPRCQPEAGQTADPLLHYIRCALSYQNQMLADIKALLQELVLEHQDEP